MTFVIASNNAKKITEMKEILASLGHEAMSQAEAGASLDVEETGQTFEENAALKAKAVLAATGLAAIADDSGLEVKALGGAPGVHSARYGGEGKTDDERNRLLLGALALVPDGERAARFVSAIVCLIPGEEPLTVRGTAEGTILRAPRGEGGFGYDPLFYLPALGRTMAELSPAEKHEISHRGAALRLFEEELRRRESSRKDGSHDHE